MTRGRVLALIAAAAVGAVLALGAGVVLTAPDTALPWSVFGAGGGNASSASYDLGATAGQPAIGEAGSSGFDLGAGFWYGVPLDADGDSAPDGGDPCPGDADCDDDSKLPPAYAVQKGPSVGGFFRDPVEVSVGTSATDRCANTGFVTGENAAGANDEADDKWPPDFNDDQKNDSLDFAKWKLDFSSPPKPYNARSDLNGDTKVDALDFAVWKTYFYSGAACVP